MRILHAINSMNPADGGPVEGVNQLSRINRHHGHQVEVLCVDAPDSPWLKKLDLTVHAVGPGRFKKYGYCPAFAHWLIRNGRNYDCVVVNGIWGFNAFGTWLALRGTEVPYVVFTHGMLDPWFKRRYPLKHLKKWLYWPWGLYPVLRDAAAVIFTCEMERKLARGSFWLYKCREIVINYGTAGVPNPENDYRPAFFAAHPQLAGKRMFLFLGRVHTKKGPDLLIKALGTLRRAGEWDPESMRLVMAGPADSEYAAQLKALVKHEALEDSVYWTGMILGDQKWGVLQASEVFVLPSHQENFGIAVVEALSCGTPVLIAHPVNISPEIEKDGAGLVDEDTLAGCLRMLRKWFALPPKAKENMRQQAAATFRQRYTSEVAAGDLIAALNHALGK